MKVQNVSQNGNPPQAKAVPATESLFRYLGGLGQGPKGPQPPPAETVKRIQGQGAAARLAGGAPLGAGAAWKLPKEGVGREGGAERRAMGRGRPNCKIMVEMMMM